MYEDSITKQDTLDLDGLIFYLGTLRDRIGGNVRVRAGRPGEMFTDTSPLLATDFETYIHELFEGDDFKGHERFLLVVPSGL